MKKPNNLKWFSLGVIVCLICSTLVTTTLAKQNTENIEVTYRDIKIDINGAIIIPKDANGNPVEPFIYNGTTYLPIRAVGNALGMAVGWDDETGIARLTTTTDITLYKVLRVIDGDTIEIDYKGTKETVRLIGVDTPESVHPDASKNTEFGEIASNFTKTQLLDKHIKLEFDVSERDKYGRLLGYVWYDEVLFNEYLVEQGYARVATYPPDVKYVERFLAAQERAREAKLGLWGYVTEETPAATQAPISSVVWVTSSGSKFHSTSTCSNMKNPIQTTRSAAISGGYTPCAKCWS